jgi:hypothetical protein
MGQLGLLSVAAPAYADFSRRIRVGEVESTELAKHAADIRNYRISISPEGTTCVIDFAPQPLQGVTLRGGGGRYVVKMEDGAIIQFAFSK